MVKFYRLLFIQCFRWCSFFAHALPTDNIRVKRLENATLCSTKDYPSLVATSKYPSPTVTGVLITMEWFLSSRLLIATVTTDIDSEKWQITAGSIYDFPSNETKNKSSKYAEEVEYHPSLLGDNDELTLLKFSPPFEKSDTIQPAKLPPNAQFASKCKQVTIVGWGREFEDSNANLVNGTERKHLLKRTEAKVIECEGKIKFGEEATLNNFCLQLVASEDVQFSIRDSGMPIFCEKGTLIGIVQSTYGETTGRDELSDRVYATDVSQYMTWLNKVTGVEVPYKSEPVYTTSTSDDGLSPATHLEARWCSILIGLLVVAFL